MIKYETNSKLIKKGQIFVAIKGHTVDGHNFIEEAIKKGCSKVVGEKDLKLSVPYEKVKNSEEYLKEKLTKEYSSQFKDLKLIGITGTNGKTTSCYLIYQMLLKLNKKIAFIGTIGYFINDKHILLNNTTPDILQLYKLLLEVKKNNIEYVVMEVSSHALSLERISGLKFIREAFTNLTEDHLDYHKNMKNYLKEKVKILNYLDNDGLILINSDDENGKNFKKAKHYQTFGLNGDYKIINYKIEPDYTNLTFSYDNKEYNVTTNLTSKFNIYNYLTCISILHSMGFKMEKLITNTKYIYAPKGRCETYKVGKGFAVIDYAHTPDAVEKVINSYKEFAKNKIITIIGCGGDRDSLKRPIMGNIVTKLCDYVYFTNDNPRTEDPKKIMNDIVKDNHSNNYEIIPDRKKAIIKAISLLEKDDILLILGKGHEDYQIIGHEKIHFSEAEIIQNYCK